MEFASSKKSNEKSNADNGPEMTTRGSAMPWLVFKAACQGEREAVVAWLDTGGHIDTLCTWKEASKDGHCIIRSASLIQAATGLGQLELTRELLQRGATIVVQNSSGRQPLTLTACFGYAACMLLLLQHSADPDLQSTDREAARGNGYTALMHAAYLGHETCVQVLLRAGASTELHNLRGETASQLAKTQRHLAVVETIAQHARNKRAGRQAAELEAAESRAQTVALEVREALEARANAAREELLAEEAAEEAAGQAMWRAADWKPKGTNKNKKRSFAPDGAPPAAQAPTSQSAAEAAGSEMSPSFFSGRYSEGEEDEDGTGTEGGEATGEATPLEVRKDPMGARAPLGRLLHRLASPLAPPPERKAMQGAAVAAAEDEFETDNVCAWLNAMSP